jgi:phosphate starvation-inducible protein PhoH
MGERCRVIFCGDFRQADLKNGQSGMLDFLGILKRMEEFDFIEFGVEDIVRSSFVKNYIIAKNDLGL